MSSPDGFLEDGTPYLDFTNHVPGGQLLEAGVTTEVRQVSFHCPGRVRLQPTFAVWGQPPLSVTASASPTTGPIPLTVAFAATTFGNVVLYEWDFTSDGTYDWSSTATPSATHTYSTIGTFTATIRVTDDLGLTATAAVVVSTQAGLEARPHATPTMGTAPLTVYFSTDGHDPLGTIQVFRWDFDGNGSWDTYDTVARDYTHTYSTPGTYNATLYVQSSTGATATASIAITVDNNPPVATADVVPSNGEVPLTVQLIGSGTDVDGQIVLYEWDFDGDGVYDWSSTTTGNTSHTYTTEGVYQAVFRITDDYGATAIATAVTTVVSVGPPGSPTATASASPTMGVAPLTVSFTGTATDPDNDIVLYEWDFDGDGVYDWSSPDTPSTSYTYDDPGIFYPAFRVVDETDLTAVDYIAITVGLDVGLSILDPDHTFDATQGESIAIGPYLSAPVAAFIQINDDVGTTIRSIPIPSMEPIPPAFSDSMESGTNGWTATGFWHLVEDSVSPYPNSHSPTHAWWYGQDSTGNFNNGSRNWGELISPDITLPEDVAFALSFWSWEQTESSGTSWDRRLVYVSTDGGSSWTQIHQRTGNTASWVKVEIDLWAYSGQSIRLKFRFDTMDSIGNSYRGWYLDDVKVTPSTTISVPWDGQDGAGFVVPDGLYYAVLAYEFDGTWHEFDLTYSTGGTRYSFPMGSGCDTRQSFPDGFTFSPFDDEVFPLTFRLCTAQEVTAFMGPLWTGSDPDRIRTIVNRKAFPAGESTVYWDGLDDQGEIAQAPGDSIITGFWRYDLPHNAIYVAGGSPVVTNVSADVNYFSPFSEKCDADGQDEGVTISYTVSGDLQFVELRVYSVETSALLRTLTEIDVEAGEQTIFWDGKNNNNEYMDIGDYRVGLVAIDGDGNESMLRYTLVRLDY